MSKSPRAIAFAEWQKTTQEARRADRIARTQSILKATTKESK
jgi:hypothetical protein